jgi:hypothetical protein
MKSHATALTAEVNKFQTQFSDPLPGSRGPSIRNYLLGRLLIIIHAYLLVRSPWSNPNCVSNRSHSLRSIRSGTSVFRNTSTVMSAAGQRWMQYFPRKAGLLLLSNQDCTCCMSQMQSTVDILPKRQSISSLPAEHAVLTLKDRTSCVETSCHDA